MQAWEQVKKDIQQAMRQGAGMLKEGTANLTAEARRMAKKGTATIKKRAAHLVFVINSGR